MLRSSVRFWLAVTAIGLGACSPALNWREVRFDTLVSLLPCKPDHGERTVQLAGQDLAMRMLGCEAAGGLFAISHVHLSDAAVGKTLVAWRASALEKMQSTAVQESVPALKFPGGTVHAMVHAQGFRADGSPVQAQLLWVTVGSELFHAAVYAQHLTPDMTEPFFSELRMQ